MIKFASFIALFSFILLAGCSVRTVSYQPGYTSYQTTRYMSYSPNYWAYRRYYAPGYRYRYGPRYSRWGYRAYHGRYRHGWYRGTYRRWH